MLMSSRYVLNQAKKKRMGIIAPDFVDSESAKVFVMTAEKMGMPIILSFAEAHKEILCLEEAAAIGKYMAESVSVPIVLHLDHGQSIEYIAKAISLGFNSVMMDASSKPFKENVRLTREVVAYAHARDVSVEAEIGHVGGETESLECSVPTASIYTDVDEAVRFVQETGVDSLAVSIGTSHGAYKHNAQPVLNFERLRELANQVDIPLVLHGGSGTGDENLKQAVSLGISKINLFTELMTAAHERVLLGQFETYLQMKQEVSEGMEDTLRHYIQLVSQC